MGEGKRSDSMTVGGWASEEAGEFCTSSDAHLRGGAEVHRTDAGTFIIDFGVDAPAGLWAGKLLAGLSLGGWSDVRPVHRSVAGRPWAHVTVQCDEPVRDCLLCQYAGWKIAVGDFFAMGSGPMRAAAGGEKIFAELGRPETTKPLVGVLEASTLPGDDVVRHIAEKCGVEPQDLILCVAPTASLAGCVQIAARSVETAMHKLHELGFDVWKVRSGIGTAPLAPAGGDDLTALGRTNDSILYGGSVTLWVDAEDDELADLAPRIPSESSDQYGRPFGELFAEAGHDFYKLDPLLFAPAEVALNNLNTGRVFLAGAVREDLVRKSFKI